MKKALTILTLIVAALSLASCNNDETYADQLNREKAAIQKYITDYNIKVISEDEFFAQDCTTDTATNEFVLMNSSGVYLQIVRKGCGEVIKDGETTNVLCRFTEWNLLTDSCTLSNNIHAYQAIVDKMSVTNTQGTYTASFDSSSSLMYSFYGSSSGSTSVLGGWLVALPYIKVGRPQSETDQIAKVRIIVPSAEGHSTASSNVTPYYYELTYERGL